MQNSSPLCLPGGDPRRCKAVTACLRYSSVTISAMHGSGYDQKDARKQWKMFIFSRIGEGFRASSCPAHRQGAPATRGGGGLLCERPGFAISPWSCEG